jgi:hypothetical protein
MAIPERELDGNRGCCQRDHGLRDEWLEIECQDVSCVTNEIEAGGEIRVFRRFRHEEAR